MNLTELIKKANRKIRNQLFNNLLINNLLISIGKEDLLHDQFQWEEFKACPGKTLQETAGFSHFPDVDETIRKIHSELEKVTDEKVPPGGKVLDIGCGTGNYLKEFAPDYLLTGIDISQAMLDITAEVVPAARLVKGGFMDVELQGGFNLVYCVGMLNYITPNRMDGFFKKISGLLESRGVVFVSYPHAIAYKDLWYHDINNINYSPEFVENKASRYFEILSHSHVVEGRSFKKYDREPFVPMNPDVDRTYKNSSILIARKKQ